MAATLRQSLVQFLSECAVGYAAASALAFPLEAAIIVPADWILNVRASPALLFFLTAPILGAFWLSAGLMAVVVHWRSHAAPGGLFGASRAGEWVWVAGAVYIVVGILTYLPVSHHWARTALYELFVNSDDIGNLATAPFYMGIAYSLTRHLLRVRTERGGARGSLWAGHAR